LVDKDYSIKQAFEDTVAQADFEHGTEQLAERLVSRLEEHATRSYRLTGALTEALEKLLHQLRARLK
ncbi:MAG TPA: hypothetical protein VHU84_04995, partial [Lacipirellulaceae bacterium]|jgi:hypothetical protein|nr:hypothetical protein [Lacipirellulaceae bacterium]